MPALEIPGGAFKPASTDILVIQSHNSMGGSGISLAFLRHPTTHKGLVVDLHGQIRELPDVEMETLERQVQDARRLIVDNFGAGTKPAWSRPQNESCPSDQFYDLGTQDGAPGALETFQLSGHEVYEPDEPDAVVCYRDGLKSVVDEIPGALVSLETTMYKLQQELLPAWDWSATSGNVQEDIQQLLMAVDSMATMNSASFWS